MPVAWSRRAFVLAVTAGVAQGCREPAGIARPTPEDVAARGWPDLVARAAGTRVAFAMWAGDEARNRFFQGPVTRATADELRVTLQIMPIADAADVVNKLLTEQHVRPAAPGSIDLVWINGENFRTAKQAGVLWGPFAMLVPNLRDYDEDAGTRDFGTPTDGYEVPWEYTQFVLAYDTARVPVPPASLDGLRRWILEHPGRFTYPAVPDFTGSAFVRHVLVHASPSSPHAFAEGFDQALYDRASRAALDLLRDLRPHLWRRGENYPATPAELHRLFVNGEVDFTMSYGPTFASERIARGEFPPTIRTFVFDEGTIANYNFLAIPFNAPNAGGALAVANSLLSADHAVSKLEAIGGLLALRPEALSPALRRRYDAVPRGPATLPLELLRERRLEEPAADYLVRLERDWRDAVLLS